MKKVVVTGGFGFIGFHLCERLLLNGVEVIAIDQMNEAEKEKQEEMELRLGRNALLTIIKEKAENADLEKLLTGIDALYHLAADTSADHTWPPLAESIENNVNLTRTLVQACPPEARFIYASTVDVYGERPGVITERTPANPTSPYGITKLTGENVIRKYAEQRGLPYVILRLPTVYGPWQRADMTYYQLLSGKEEVESDRSTLDVLYVDDVVDAFMLAGKTKHVNEVYQLSSGKANQWVRGVEHVAPDHPLTASPRFETSLSAEKSKDMLGFEAKVSLQEGLAKQREHMTQWLKQQQLQKGRE
ncbi:NAD-dependent epimerase/dehydratase family protein [Halalkalibacter oceani]|uniref:NAD-dependent epimerase/dehydratase family protein n=1 Tax=Halalkalibacter oceani TaxID=1653776 RepID=UPI0033960738